MTANDEIDDGALTLRNIVLQEGRRECLALLVAAGYRDAAVMLLAVVDEMQVWIDSNPIEPDDKEPSP